MHTGITTSNPKKKMLIGFQTDKGSLMRRTSRQSTNCRQPQSTNKNKNGVSQAIRFPSLFRKRYVEEPSSREKRRKCDDQRNSLNLTDFKMSSRQKEYNGPITYKALHIPSGKMCFVKDQPRPDSPHLSTFFQKIQTLCQKQPEGIVQYYGCVTVGARLLIIEEYMSEGSLSDFLLKNKYPCFIRKCFQKVIKILINLEVQNIHPINIQLSNILLNSQGEVKLTDVIRQVQPICPLEQFHRAVRQADRIVKIQQNQQVPHLNSYQQILNWYFAL